MPKLLTLTVFSIGLMSFASTANTLITSENLDRLQASHAAVQALDKQFQDEDQDEFNTPLEPHCDWQKHYQSFNKDNVTQAQVRQFEDLIKQYGFRSGAEYYELNMKVISQGLTAMESHLKQHNITLNPNSRIDKGILQMQQLNQVIRSCLTNADKAALTRYEARINEILALMATDDDDKGDFDQHHHDMQH